MTRLTTKLMRRARRRRSFERLRFVHDIAQFSSRSNNLKNCTRHDCPKGSKSTYEFLLNAVLNQQRCITQGYGMSRALGTYQLVEHQSGS